MVLILIVSCLSTPVNIAFPPKRSSETIWNVYNTTVDLLFLLEMFVVFNTALYDEYFQFIDKRKTIACKYLKGWFTVDLLAIFPFETILNASNLNGLVRLAKIGRLYKLVKLTRLLRVFKIIKD
jgi:hypothetical protein